MIEAPLITSRLEAAPTTMKGPDCFGVDVEIKKAAHGSVEQWDIHLN